MLIQIVKLNKLQLYSANPYACGLKLETTVISVSLLFRRLRQVPIGDAIDGIYGADPATWRAMTPCYSLRRLECRHQLQVQHAESLARCCRHLQHLCLRGRHSARNDLMALHW